MSFWCHEKVRVPTSGKGFLARRWRCPVLTSSLPRTEEPGAVVPWLCMARRTGDCGSARNQIQGCCFVLLGFLCRGGDAKPCREVGACRKSEDEGEYPRRASRLGEGHVWR